MATQPQAARSRQERREADLSDNRFTSEEHLPSMNDHRHSAILEFRPPLLVSHLSLLCPPLVTFSLGNVQTWLATYRCRFVSRRVRGDTKPLRHIV
jgi:hypothetical protein